MEAFDLAVALRMERGCGRFPQLKVRDLRQEVPGRELLAVVVDDTDAGIGIEFLVGKRTG